MKKIVSLLFCLLIVSIAFSQEKKSKRSVRDSIYMTIIPTSNGKLDTVYIVRKNDTVKKVITYTSVDRKMYLKLKNK